MADQFDTVEGAFVQIPSLADFKRSGVYFLYRDGVVVYVGQAVDVRRRIATHIGEGVKSFDSASFIPVPQRSLLRAEQMWIKKLRPEYNRTHNTIPVDLEQPNGRVTVDNVYTKGQFNVVEAAAYLGLDASALQQLHSTGELRSIRQSRSRRRVYRACDLDDYRVRMTAQT